MSDVLDKGSLKMVKQDFWRLTLSLLAEQYWRVHSMEDLIPDSDDEKLQILSANWIEGTTRSC